MKQTEKIRCAIIGYGSFGRMHGRWISVCSNLELVAVCDINRKNQDAAIRDFPGIQTYGEVATMLSAIDVDLVSIVTPHNTHASITVECLKAGKHVVVEKPMASTVKECTLMIEEAKRHQRTLAVFHNRRHDGNYRAIKQVINEGLIGDVFHVECCDERYAHPGKWWYTNKEISGGVLFYWGPHAVDWILNLIRSKLSNVIGSTHKKVWMDVNVEDEIRATLLFKDGSTAVLNYSTISCVRRPLWRILSTKGAILDSPYSPISGATIPGYTEKITVPPSGSFQLFTIGQNGIHKSQIPYLESDWLSYYVGLADHLLHQKPVPVSGEEGRRVIAVIEAIQKSAKSERCESILYE